MLISLRTITSTLPTKQIHLVRSPIPPRFNSSFFHGRIMITAAASLPLSHLGGCKSVIGNGRRSSRRISPLIPTSQSVSQSVSQSAGPSQDKSLSEIHFSLCFCAPGPPSTSKNKHLRSRWTDCRRIVLVGFPPFLCTLWYKFPWSKG